MNDRERFDGVFEMVLHPTYLLSYIGYYGMALLTHSYTVLFVGLAAHFTRLLFFYYIERPHSAKIYNASPSAYPGMY